MNPFSNLSLKSLVAACSVLLAVPAAFAGGTIYLEVGPQYGQVNPYQYADGGEFTALTTGLGSYLHLESGLPKNSQVPVGYAAAATYTVGGVTGFETFCVEDQVDFNVGDSYDYTLGTKIQQTNSKGYLTVGVAWLYSQFAQGKLAGYDYNSPSTSTDKAKRLADAGELQAAIWALEGEPQDPNDPLNTSTNPFYKDALAKFGSLSAAEASVTAHNDFDVQVLELTDCNGIHQDQLVYSVPDTAVTALLVGASVLGLVALRRRLATR